MKALKIATLVFFSALWVLGLANYDRVYPYLYRSGLIEDEYRYGDLFRLSYLPQFKEVLTTCQEPLTLRKTSSRPLHLYVLGDSFLEPQRIDSSDFVADQYHFIKWDNFQHVRLDTAATNVVLIESVERHLRQHFDGNPASYFIADTANFPEKWSEKKWMSRIDNFFKSDRTESQLGLLLTSNRLGVWCKELKSAFNFRVFNRTESGVTVSNDKKHLVYYLDTDTLNYPYTSGFSHLTEARVDSVVQGVNKTQEELLAMGFDHFVLSVIPNKSTIVMPDYGPYNHLIERVQQHPGLKAPLISVLDEYRKLGAAAYLVSDSHWTCEARSVWVQKINRHLLGLSSTVPARSCMTPGSRNQLIRKTL
ncbi:hypothetical protein GCM10023091_26430 [Ravibacter arvi]|uniref:AlgX/AlgJ SGNH hydrolase-like domain-containing protein n=1 Tax=Ravibacter arvi TaxID=2051041 RepID=A0ABP8M2W0_9BACT